VSKKKPGAVAPTEAPVTTQSAGPVAKKKPSSAKVEPPKPVEVPFTKNDFCKKLFAGILTEKLGKGWSKVEDYATEAAEIAKVLETEAVVCSIDGEMPESFRERVIAELESRYDFE
jgi:hypothetical protein